MVGGSKRCPKCQTEKPLEGFNRSRRSRDGHQSWCKLCSNRRSRMRPPDRPLPPPSTFKVCSKCSQEKPLESFYMHRWSRDGRKSRCKPCENEDIRLRRANRPRPAPQVPELKVCSVCGTEKPLHPDYFTRKRAAKSGLQARCKECDRKYVEQNRERIRARNADWEKAHK